MLCGQRSPHSRLLPRFTAPTATSFEAGIGVSKTAPIRLWSPPHILTDIMSARAPLAELGSRKIVSQSQNARFLLWTIPIIVIAGGCARTRWLTSTDNMRATVCDSVPAGTSIEDAVAFMQSEGFDCQIEHDSRFVAKQHWSHYEPIHDNIDFIRCKRHQSAGHVFMTRYWSVALVINEETTTGEILVANFVDGP